MPLLGVRLILVGAVVLGVSGCDKNPAGNSSGSNGNPTAAIVEPPIERELEKQWTGYIGQSKQEIFNAIHPLGKALDARLHEVKVKWKNDVRTNRHEDIEFIGVRYTLFWEGPITKDGYTKLASLYDPEVGRITTSEIHATNGFTNDDCMEGLGIAVGAGIGASMGGRGVAGQGSRLSETPFYADLHREIRR